MRGRFVVVEGARGSGKTSLCVDLTSSFPHFVFSQSPGVDNRYYSTAKIMSEYLRGGTSWGDYFGQLLYVANRWDFCPEIDYRLYQGKSVLSDGYSYSTVATSAAKGCSLEWCQNTEKGLIKPDLVICLSVSHAERERRTGEQDRHGYDDKVAQILEEMSEENWVKINTTDMSPDEVAILAAAAIKKLSRLVDKPPAGMFGSDFLMEQYYEHMMSN
jgi:dTMP kinase